MASCAAAPTPPPSRWRPVLVPAGRSDPRGLRKPGWESFTRALRKGRHGVDHPKTRFGRKVTSGAANRICNEHATHSACACQRRNAVYSGDATSCSGTRNNGSRERVAKFNRRGSWLAPGPDAATKIKTDEQARSRYAWSASIRQQGAVTTESIRLTLGICAKMGRATLPARRYRRAVALQSCLSSER